LLLILTPKSPRRERRDLDIHQRVVEIISLRCSHGCGDAQAKFVD
jgi:hypothetical protein